MSRSMSHVYSLSDFDLEAGLNGQQVTCCCLSLLGSLPLQRAWHGMFLTYKNYS